MNESGNKDGLQKLKKKHYSCYITKYKNLLEQDNRQKQNQIIKKDNSVLNILKFFQNKYTSSNLIKKLKRQSLQYKSDQKLSVPKIKNSSQIIKFFNQDYYLIEKNILGSTKQSYPNLQIQKPKKQKKPKKYVIILQKEYKEKCEKGVMFRRNKDIVFKIELRQNLKSISINFQPQILQSEILKSYDDFCYSKSEIKNLDQIDVLDNFEKSKFLYIQIQSRQEMPRKIKLLFRYLKKKVVTYDYDKDKIQYDENMFNGEQKYSSFLNSDQITPNKPLVQNQNRKFFKRTNSEKIMEIKELIQRRADKIQLVQQRKKEISQLQKYKQKIIMQKLFVNKFNVFQKEQNKKQN